MHRELDIYLKSLDLSIAAKHWFYTGKERAIAVHGWLDNASSFDMLLPHLPFLNTISIDLPGHGFSQHLPKSSSYTIAQYINVLFAVAEDMRIERFHLLGHSLGAAICSLAAGVFPEKIKSLTLFDGLGPTYHSPENTAKSLRDSIEPVLKNAIRTPSIYDDYNHALLARQKNSQLTLSACHVLARRGVAKVNQGFSWRYDPRLKLASRQRFTEEEVLSILKKVTCPVTLIRPENGIGIAQEIYDKRLNSLDNLTVVRVSGGHDVHLCDPFVCLDDVQRFHGKFQ